ncbi:MAG: hypothetical protein COT73_06805 [Bdellovibrio sp. CG10_big_fil_rev_8_21_14_0_10_47_8]|nr:MAG: hypothetical protein COT73_06805 [Bdellovibrio sp. CG10_big_fil_rev_8_21_14_0_10_47_8]
MITGDDKAQVTTTFSDAQVDTQVQQGVWYKDEASRRTRSLKIETAHIFADRWQAGLSVPVLQKSQAGAQGGESSGLGDLAAQLGYEYLPDWDYNPWRPKGVGFLALVTPTGTSRYEADRDDQSRGRGLWSIGVGTILSKNWILWDMSSSLEIHRSLSKSVHTSQVEGSVEPGFGGTWSIGAGYNWSRFRCGASIAWAYEDAVSVAGTQGDIERSATGTLLLSSTFQNNWAGTLAYADQTWFGDPSNTTLSKTILLSVQKRWAR